MLTNAPLDMEYVRAQFPGLQSGWVFFDNAGGSQILKGAVERINTFLYEKNVQIGGSYEVSVAAANALKEARDAARVLVNAQRSDEIVFGASTTVLMQNLAAAMRSQLSPGDEIVICVADHESNIGPWDRLSEFGIVIKTWPINHETLKLELSDLEPLMSDRTRLVCVHHVSNILGEINPIREIADFVHAHGARICVDAVAYAPHRAIDVQALDVDYYAFSLYKTYGPHTAVMYGKHSHLLELDTLYHYFYGKDKVPGKLEPGNPNYELAYSILGITDYLQELGRRAGASPSASPREQVEAAFTAITAQENTLVERLLSWANGRDDVHLVGQRENTPASTRIPTIAFTVDGWTPEALCREMDPKGIAIRHGDFHSRRLIEDLGLAEGGGVVRVSMVHYNTLEEVDRLTRELDAVLDGARDGSRVARAGGA
ncbi:MAG: cysteine desulfurase-like protein [Rhodobacteraceae bacterium]|nr:cysteine desulfurase-like protein [Paracoccaceae bacterium]